MLSKLSFISTKNKTKKFVSDISSITETSFMKEAINKHFNIGSHIQLKKALKHLGIQIKNTEIKTLQSYNVKKPHPIINKLIEFKENNKRVSTYGVNFLRHIHPKTGRIHTEWYQLGTRSGRFSSSPNLQNIPTYTENDKYVYRECFQSRDGYSLLIADYSQAELRFAGAVSGEPKIINAYKNNEDIHRLTASLIYNKDIGEIDRIFNL
jgi:DNA polymerase-1